MGRGGGRLVQGDGGRGWLVQGDGAGGGLVQGGGGGWLVRGGEPVLQSPSCSFCQKALPSGREFCYSVGVILVPRGMRRG